MTTTKCNGTDCVKCAGCGESGLHSFDCSLFNPSLEVAEFWDEDKDESAGVMHADCGFQAGMVLA